MRKCSHFPIKHNARPLFTRCLKKTFFENDISLLFKCKPHLSYALLINSHLTLLFYRKYETNKFKGKRKEIIVKQVELNNGHGENDATQFRLRCSLVKTNKAPT